MRYKLNKSFSLYSCVYIYIIYTGERKKEPKKEVNKFMCFITNQTPNVYMKELGFQKIQQS